MFSEILSHQLARPQTIRLKSTSWMIPFQRRSSEQTINSFSPILIMTSTAAVSFVNTSNVIKRPHAQAPIWHTLKGFGGKPCCLITHPNMTISAPLKTCKFENFGSSSMPRCPEVSGRPQNTPLAVEHITLSKVVNTGFLHNYLIPFTRLRKYWLFIAIKGHDCKKQVKVSGYI